MTRAGAEGGDEVVTPSLDTPKKYDMASRRLLSQLTSTPQGHRSLFVGNLNGGQAQPRETGRADAPPDRRAQQDHQPGINNNTIHSCSFLINIFPFLARTVSQVGDTSEFSKVVSATKEVLD